MKIQCIFPLPKVKSISLNNKFKFAVPGKTKKGCFVKQPFSEKEKKMKKLTFGSLIFINILMQISCHNMKMFVFYQN